MVSTRYLRDSTKLVINYLDNRSQLVSSNINLCLFGVTRNQLCTSTRVSPRPSAVPNIYINDLNRAYPLVQLIELTGYTNIFYSQLFLYHTA